MQTTSVPLLLNFANANGFHPLLVGMIWTYAAGGMIFLHQSAVLIAGYSFGDFEAKDLRGLGA